MRIRKRLPSSSTSSSTCPPPLLADLHLHRRAEVQFPPLPAESVFESGESLRNKISGGERFFGANEDETKKKKKKEEHTVGRGGDDGNRKRADDDDDVSAAIENSREVRKSGAAAVVVSTNAITSSSSIKDTCGGIPASYSSFSAGGVNVFRHGGGVEPGVERCVPLKKRKGVMIQETVQQEDDKRRSNNHPRTKSNKKQEEHDDENMSGSGVAAVKKKGRGGAHMEGSRCSRVNGRGWRCCQQTLVGYSLCEHHLGKGRLRSLTSVRSGAPKNSPPRSPRFPSPDAREWNHSSRLDADEEYDYRDGVGGEDDSDYEEEDGSRRKKRKRPRIGMVKARLLSSLLSQPETDAPTAASKPYVFQG